MSSLSPTQLLQQREAERRMAREAGGGGQAPTGVVISPQEQARYAAQMRAIEQARQVSVRQEQARQAAMRQNAQPQRGPFGIEGQPRTKQETENWVREQRRQAELRAATRAQRARAPEVPPVPPGTAPLGGQVQFPTRPGSPGTSPMPSGPGVAPLPTMPSGLGMPLGTAPPGGQAGDLAAAVRATGVQGDTFQGRPVPSNTDPMGALRAISGGTPGAPGMALGTPAFAKGGSVRTGRSAMPSSQSKAASKSKGMPAKAPKPARYARGGSVRGAGCEVKGLKKATIY